MKLSLISRMNSNKELLGQKLPNTVCSEQLGVAAFFERFPRFSTIPFPNLIRVLLPLTQAIGSLEDRRVSLAARRGAANPLLVDTLSVKERLR